MRFLPFILRNALRSKRRRTILTVLSIVVSLFLFCTIRTVLTSFDQSLETADAARLITRRATSLTFFMPLSYKDRIAQIPGVEAVSYSIWFGGIYIDERHFFPQFVADPRGYLDLYPEFLVSPEERLAFERERTACIVGEKLAAKYNFKVGDRIPLKGTIFPGDWDLTVRAIARGKTKSVDTNFLLFSWDYLNESLGNLNQVGWYVSKLSDPTRAGEISRRIDETFANSSAETKTETEKAFQLGFITMLGNIRMVVFAVGTAIVIAIMLVAMNTMMMAARERTREIAVLKAVGFTDRTVLGLVLAESLLITLAGGIVGTGLARIIYDVAGFTGGGFFTTFLVTWGTIAQGLILAVVMGLISGAVPAYNASRLKVVDALARGLSMAIPIQYNLRNLTVRRTATLMTAGGIGLVVAILVLTLALAGGFRQTLVSTGRADNAIITRAGATSEILSGLTREDARIISASEEIAQLPGGEPLAVSDVVVVTNLKKRSDPAASSNITVRGADPRAMLLRPQVRIVEGRMYKLGVPEIIVGRPLSRRFVGCGLGESIRFGTQDWHVVGVFEADGSGFESEIWGDGETLGPLFDRTGFSSVTVRLIDTRQLDALARHLEADPRLHVDVKRESDYYKAQSEQLANVIRGLGFFLVFIMAAGAIFGALNTMYAAVGARTREIGTMMAIGFTPGSILVSFLLESVFLCMIGGVLGCILALPIHGVTTGTTNWSSFSELSFNFRITPGILLAGMISSVVLGVIGGFFPARNAARRTVSEALRE